jgi:hypothetical protein
MRFPEPVVNEMATLIKDFVNELNLTIEASRFYYERYLDFIEFSFNVEEEPGVSPDEFMQKGQENHERAQVEYVIGIADAVLGEQLNLVLHL